MIEQQLGYNCLFIDQDCSIEEWNASIAIRTEKNCWTKLKTNIDESRLSVLEWKGTCFHSWQLAIVSYHYKNNFV